MARLLQWSLSLPQSNDNYQDLRITIFYIVEISRYINNFNFFTGSDLKLSV